MIADRNRAIRPTEGVFMSKLCLSLISSALLIVATLGAAQAQTRRVFVAAQGADANDCSFANPCRTFNRAASVVSPGGEIDVLDPAGYGSISVTKALSVQGHGFAGISPAASSASGVFVAAGGSDKVFLSGLIIEGENFGSTGITFQSGATLTIENTVIRNWNDSGIAIVPSSTACVGNCTISVTDTVVADNGGHGIFLQPPPSSSGPEIL